MLKWMSQIFPTASKMPKHEAALVLGYDGVCSEILKSIHVEESVPAAKREALTASTLNILIKSFYIGCLVERVEQKTKVVIEDVDQIRELMSFVFEQTRSAVMGYQLHHKLSGCNLETPLKTVLQVGSNYNLVTTLDRRLEKLCLISKEKSHDKFIYDEKTPRLPQVVMHLLKNDFIVIQHGNDEEELVVQQPSQPEDELHVAEEIA